MPGSELSKAKLGSPPLGTSGVAGFLLRLFAYGSLTLALAYVVNNFLIHRGDFPRLFEGGWVVALVYLAATALAGGLTMRAGGKDLALTAAWFSQVGKAMVRGAFWAVVLVGLIDALISFLRIEGFAPALVGEALASDLNKQNFRGPYLHLPLVVLGFGIGFLTRGLGFIWLTLLVVFAQLAIVVTLNVYSYEQAFQSDLVRFWYAALFLFAAAYTLLEGGHVRVDVLFSSLSQAQKSLVNFWGALLLGLPLAWITLIIGTWDQSRIINSPILRYEIGQQSVGGLYIKYLMAGFLLVFAVTLIIEFVALMLASAHTRARLKAAADQGDQDQEAL